MYIAPPNATNPLNDDDLRASFLRTAVDLLRPVFVYGMGKQYKIQGLL